MIDTSKITLEWLAGFFDGEGSVSFNSKRKGATLKVNLTQADLPLMAAIAIKFGANGPYEKHCKRSKRPIYEVNWSGRKAGEFLKLIQPYAIRKSEQIALGIKLASLYVGQGNELTINVIEQRLEICDKLRGLNSMSIRSDAQQEEYTN